VCAARLTTKSATCWSTKGPGRGAPVRWRWAGDPRGSRQIRPQQCSWQRDLSVSYERIGGVLVAQGNLAEALQSYRDGQAIRELLAKSDPDNAHWQRDLSISYERIGSVLAAQGNLAEALQSYCDGQAIRERLAKSDPGNAGGQRAGCENSFHSLPRCKNYDALADSLDRS
jgi:tetratricopeptide (TPR) repeat protein